MIFKSLCLHCRADFPGEVPKCVWCGSVTVRQKPKELDIIKSVNKNRFLKYKKKLMERGIL